MSILKLPKDVLILLVTKYIDPKTAGDCLYLCKKIYQYLYDSREDLIYNMNIAIKCYYNSNRHKYTRQCSECNNIIRKKKFKEHIEKHIDKDAKPIKSIHCYRCWTPVFPIEWNDHKCPLRITTCSEEKIKMISTYKRCHREVLKHVIDTNPTCEYRGVSVKVKKHVENTCLKTKCYKCNTLIKLNTCFLEKCQNCRICC